MFQGFTVVDAPTVITTHLTEIIRDNMFEPFLFQTQKLLDELDGGHQKLIADLVPNQINIGGIQRVLQNLLVERVSIRDLATILEGVSKRAATPAISVKSPSTSAPARATAIG